MSNTKEYNELALRIRGLVDEYVKQEGELCAFPIDKPSTVIKSVVACIATTFQNNNTRFNVNQFYEACGF